MQETPPTKAALDAADKITSTLVSIGYPPSRRVPTVEGGVILYFYHANLRYALLDIYDDGQVVAGWGDPKEPSIVADWAPNNAATERFVKLTKEFFGSSG